MLKTLFSGLLLVWVSAALSLPPAHAMDGAGSGGELSGGELSEGDASTDNVANHLPTTVSFEGQFQLQFALPDGSVPVNQYHTWQLRVLDAEGRPVDNLRIHMDGGMIAHGHGLPSSPQVTATNVPGVYQIEGLLFNMYGAWTLQFILQGNSITDRAQLQFELDY